MTLNEIAAQFRTPPEIAPEPQWHSILERCRAEPGVIVVLGRMDAGKTSLCRWLSYTLADEGTVAVIDADLGQSRIGPPGTVGIKIIGNPASSFCFVGDTSPARCQARHLGAIAHSLSYTQGFNPRWIILDTTGWIAGQLAIEHKIAKIAIARPRHIIAVHDGQQLQPVLRALPAQVRKSVCELPTSPSVRRKSPAQRNAWRRERIAHHLDGADSHWFDCSEMSVVNGPDVAVVRRGQLVGLDDEAGIGLGVGVLRTWAPETRRALIVCRVEAQAASGLQFGGLVLDMREIDAAQAPR